MLKNKGGRAAAAAAIVLIFAATWALLDRSEHRPRWLTAEAPAAAVVGHRLEIRVRLDGAVEATKIACTLHRTRADRKGGNYLASSGPARSAVGGGTYSFVFEVPDHKDMAFAFAIIYLSPTGEWKDGTRAVSTEHLPLRRDGAAVAGSRLKEIPVHHFMTAKESEASRAAGRRPRPQASLWVHPFLGLILLAAALASLLNSARARQAGVARGLSEASIWLAFAAIFVLSAALEVSGLVGHLAAWARRLAEETNVYQLRRPYQKAIMAAVAAFSLGLFFLFIRAIRRPSSHRPFWWAGIGLAAYLAVSFVGVLSFHAVDVVRGMTWYGVSPVDAVRGAGALVTLIAAIIAFRRKNGRAAT